MRDWCSLCALLQSYLGARRSSQLLEDKVAPISHCLMMYLMSRKSRIHKAICYKSLFTSADMLDQLRSVNFQSKSISAETWILAGDFLVFLK